MLIPEDQARENIDHLLTQAGWAVQDKKAVNLSASRGVAVRVNCESSGTEARFTNRFNAERRVIGTTQPFTLSRFEQKRRHIHVRSYRFQ